MSSKYQPTKIEKKWQKFWKEKRLFEAKDFDKNKKKFYHLVMFPYPSGDLHIGHWFIFAPADTYARFKYMQSHNVLSPIGFDAFGLPAENAAIKRKLHPKKWTQDNIKRMTKQFESMGPMYDWSRVISTADPKYYKWTQWMFLQMYKKGLVYKKKQSANWCPSCQTVLANEQVEAGLCFRCGSTIEIKEIEQWLFKITEYADRLLTDLNQLDWPEKTKIMQRNWIGRSEGTEIQFKVKSPAWPAGRQKLKVKNATQNSKVGEGGEVINVFTTRSDTVFGATYLVLAPEHPLVKQIIAQEHTATVGAYIEQAKHKTERQRKEGSTEKTGVFTGAYAINPANNQEIPIWVADYVLMGYGTGAIMAVPAHDRRDMEFAKKFGLSIVDVIAISAHVGEKQSQVEMPNSKIKILNKSQNLNDKITQVYEGEGQLINSGQFDGMDSQEAKNKITEWLEAQGKAKKTVQYRLRDWIVSRQRYWGAPIPIIYCDHCGSVPVPEEDLPVKLPNIKNYLPKGKPPLATAAKWVNTECPMCRGSAKRETETLDTFVDSSWYFLRYPDPGNSNEFCDRKKLEYWCPVEIYIGGAEHTVLHLLYARFFTKVLYDLKYVRFNEPFPKLCHQGFILGIDRQKMSKSRGNVIDPDELVSLFGSDAVRMYLMFMGPYDQGGPWNPEGIRGIRRFVDRVYKFILDKDQRSIPNIANETRVNQMLHRKIVKITTDLEQLHFNTAIAHLMELLNTFEKYGAAKSQIISFIKLLAPFAPHLADELWSHIGHETSVFQSTWPISDHQYVEQKTVFIAVAYNGKTRGTIESSPTASQHDVEQIVARKERFKTYYDDKKIKKVIYVPSKIINFVIE